MFVLAGGRRTGSTLLQRLLISTGEIMIWGEHDGTLMRHLNGIMTEMVEWNAVNAKDQLKKFIASGYNNWIPNVNPRSGDFVPATRGYFRNLFGRTARTLDYPRWGFKEVCYGAEAALWLEKLFPEASFVLLVRHPRDCLLSLKATRWGGKHLQGGPEDFLSKWATLSRELMEVNSKLRQSALFRYEDLVADPEKGVAGIAKVTGIAEEKFRTSEVFGAVLFGSKDEGVRLEPSDLTALEQPDVKRIMELFGYI